MCPKDADRIAIIVDPDQTAPFWSGSALFAQTYLFENWIITALPDSYPVFQFTNTIFHSVIHLMEVWTNSISNRATTWQNQQSECAPTEDSDQPGHPPSLISVFTVRLMGS